MIDPAGLGDVVGEYGPGGAIARYTYGLGLVSRTDAAGTAYYDFDALGSTVGMTTASGSYANRYAYTPFGETLAATRTMANPFTFVGQFGVMADLGAGCTMRARYYYAPVGRFISQDPIGIAGGINLYAYSSNNPTLFVDPAGLYGTCPAQWFDDPAQFNNCGLGGTQGFGNGGGFGQGRGSQQWRGPLYRNPPQPPKNIQREHPDVEKYLRMPATARS
ncbi:MAG: RHS repeat-associated core domain-containing protein [Gemmataceae bacterium]